MRRSRPSRVYASTSSAGPTTSMSHVVLLNLGLFVPVVIGGILAGWFGWTLVGDGDEDDRELPSAGPDELARSA